jgi:hypothetical protein
MVTFEIRDITVKEVLVNFELRIVIVLGRSDMHATISYNSESIRCYYKFTVAEEAYDIEDRCTNTNIFSLKKRVKRRIFTLITSHLIKAKR